MSYPNDDTVKEVASWRFQTVKNLSSNTEVLLPIHYDDLLDEADPAWVDADRVTDPNALILNLRGPEPRVCTLLEFILHQHPIDADEVIAILSEIGRAHV